MDKVKIVMADQKKGATEGVFQIRHCAFPDCYGEAKVQVSALYFCRRHAEFARFFLWVAGQIRVKEEESNVTKSGLIIPK